jgi:AmmeMemoRadiSam system protein B
MIDQIKNTLRPEYSLKLVSEKILDHGSAIPLYLLKNSIANSKIIIISPAQNLSLENHLAFGKSLGKIIRESDKNIAVIASGDLSHRLKRKSPGGYSPKGTKFDNKIIEYLSNPETAEENILKMDSNLIKEAAECGLKPLAIILGILKEYQWEPNILAYQTDFGIGYLSLSFKI